MKRIPSIHITEEELAEILNQGFRFPPHKIDWYDVAKYVVERAKTKSLNNRSVSVSNNKLERDIKNLIKASDSDASLLSNLIYHIRRRKTKLYTTKRIEKGTKEYTQLKELTKVCVDFCNTFNLSKKAGFTTYLELAIPKISSSLNYVNKLVNMAEKIYQIQEAKQLIENDSNKSETKNIHDLYVGLIATKTGITNDYTTNPIIYCKFIEIREVTDRLDIPVDIYIKAQFNALSWTDSFPEPNQLVGDKAIERLNKYMYENKLSSVNNNKDDSKKGKNILLKLKNKYDNDRGN